MEVDRRYSHEFDRLPREIASAVVWFMRQRNIAQEDLATILGVSRGRMAHILSGGDQNLTMSQLASIAAELDGHFEIKFVANEPEDLMNEGE